ncbi:UPF0012 hydrolase yhcX [Ilyonectria robusta]
MSQTYRIALLQLQSKSLDVEDNYERATKLISDAASQGAHLAVLPEYHLTSWVPDHPDFCSAIQKSSQYLSQYQTLAKTINISIVPGTICHVNKEAAGSLSQSSAGTEMVNIAYFIAAGTGEILSSYQKRNLWHPERPHLTAGHDPHRAFDLPLTREDGRKFRAGLLICWDLAFPEACRQLVADGADLIVVPSFWHLSDIDLVGKMLNPSSEKIFLESVTVARAYENTCAIALCNSGGFSQVAMPMLGCLGKLEPEMEATSIVDIDFDVLRIAETNYKIREDMERSGWEYRGSTTEG